MKARLQVYQVIAMATRALTYLTFGDFEGLGDAVFARAAEKRGFVRADRAAKHVTLVLSSTSSVGHKFDRRSFSVTCDIKNLLDIATHAVITNKRTLHATVAEHHRAFYERYFARTWDLRTFVWRPEYTTEHRAFIIRPSTVGFFSGKGITRATSERDITAARERWSHFPANVAQAVIVSEYLDYPYLVERRKFHLRMYMRVIRARDDPAPRCDWFGADDAKADPTLPRGKLLTAGAPYARADYDNADIHDTHFATTPRALFFPMHARDITDPDGKTITPRDISLIWSQLEEIRAQCEVLLENVAPYAESRAGYEIFAFDLLIVRDAQRGPGPRVIVIEVNDRVGFATQPCPATTRWSADFIEFNFRAVDTLRESLKL